jgi:ATP-dependent DNA helicase RecG
MAKYTIAQLQHMRESEDHVEFKKGEGGNVSYNGANKDNPKERRKCILGYVVALCNEGGGLLVIGMHDDFPHKVVGTKQSENAIGQLESNIYRDLGIRPYIYELYEDETTKTGRVLVIQVPPRPTGKIFKFEDVALMRVGEELKPMDDKTYISIIQEQEPDFSEQFCEGVTLKDLDEEAINILKEKYALKQKNPSFRTLSHQQALSDLKLVQGDKLTNAAVLLLGKEDVIDRIFPQAKVSLEFRNIETQIPFDSRKIFGKPFYKLIDELWETINHRNGIVPIQEGAYIGLTGIPFFNEEVIREAINNAFAHRDYRRASEIVIKMYPHRIDIINAGGFPQGVTLDNLLTVSSTPRNRLLADVLSKTGIVERSGQGVDKIFFHTLAEGKPEPDYSRTDDFSVTAILYSYVKEMGFALFIQTVQKELPETEKLSVFDILTLCKIRDGERKQINKDIAKRLEAINCIEKHGKTNAQYYTLPRRYYELAGKTADYSMITDWNAEQVMAVLGPYLQKYGKAKKSDIVKIVGNHISEKQLRNYLDQLKSIDFIKTEGERGQMVYMLGKSFLDNSDIITKAIKIGLKTLIEKGEI